MTRALPVSLALAAVVAAGGGWWLYERAGSGSGIEAGVSPASAEALIDQYCSDCHNPVDRSGNLSLTDRDLAKAGDDAEIFEHVVRKLRTGMMPPAGEPRPERAALDGLAALLETRLDAAAAESPMPGPAMIRRLNRSEYANAIRDLLDLDVDAATLLPLDDSSEGFDNIAAALGTSPSLAEAYVSSAMKLSRLALGDRNAPRTQVSYAVPEGLRQDRHLEGLPLGTRGGFVFDHSFPLDAEYAIDVRRGFGGGGQVDLTIDGVPVAIGGRGGTRIPVTAGPHRIAVASVETRRSYGVDDLYSAPPPTGGIQGVEIDGPFDPVGVGDTPSRRRILICEPETSAEAGSGAAAEAATTACAREIVSSLATRAFRRPLADDELPALMAFYTEGEREDGFETGIQRALARILVDPRFLYRIENDPPGMAPGTVYAIDDYALATRLSFFLWSSIPDEALLATAASGRLHEPEVLRAELDRMLADAKSNALTENFASQWLFLRELQSVTPDSDAFDVNLRESMARETELLFDTILREDRSILRLLDADFTFVDDRLAEHYGYEDIRGSHFRRIEIPRDSPRRGLLGHASILTVTSVTNRTSPVIRGSWILGTLLGSPAPVPPPDVETTLEGDDGAAVAQTVRERLEAHRQNPVCASCHSIMDPIGFSLENFDLIGAWRDTDSGQAIDTRAVLVDGTVVDSAATLRAALLARSDAFVMAATEKLMTYALGRRLEHYDMPTVRAIVADAAAVDYRLSALIAGVVESNEFRMRLSGGAE